MKISSKLSQCPDLCLGYFDNANDPTDICICGYTFLTAYQEKGNQIWEIGLIESGALGIVVVGCIAAKKVCKKPENQDLINSPINVDAERSRGFSLTRSCQQKMPKLYATN